MSLYTMLGPHISEVDVESYNNHVSRLRWS